MDAPARGTGPHFSMIRNFHLADFFTLGNGACGTAAIFVAMSHAAAVAGTGATGATGAGRLVLAGALLLLALVLDILDGRVARWRRKDSPMGRELDSLSDVISFGVSPACLAWSAGLRGGLDIAVLLYFVACGISRLARYNVTAEQIAEQGGGKVRYFEGTPIPTSVLVVALLVDLGLADRLGERLPGGAISLGGAVLHPLVLIFAVSGSLMISKTVRIPKP